MCASTSTVCRVFIFARWQRCSRSTLWGFKVSLFELDVETYLAATVCEQAEWEPRRKNTRGVSKVSPVPVLLLSADQCWRKQKQQLLLLLIIKPNNRAFIASAYLGLRAGVLKLQKHRLWKRSVDAVWSSRSLPWLLQTQTACKRSLST